MEQAQRYCQSFGKKIAGLRSRCEMVFFHYHGQDALTMTYLLIPSICSQNIVSRISLYLKFFISQCHLLLLLLVLQMYSYLVFYQKSTTSCGLVPLAGVVLYFFQYVFSSPLLLPLPNFVYRRTLLSMDHYTFCFTTPVNHTIAR